MMDRHAQIDLFVADILDITPKGDLTTMEHPVFALSTKPDKEVWEYRNPSSEIYIKVSPSQAGRPTIFDKDLLMYCISHVVEGMNRGRQISRRVHITAYDFLKATGRGTGGKDYEALLAAAERLRGVTITIQGASQGKTRRRADVRGLIESATVIESDNKGRMVHLEIVLSEWIYEAIEDKRILTYHPSYYTLRKPNERRLYELCRKFCGTQAKWQIGEEKLYRYFGTRATVREFRRKLKQLVDEQNIPDYQVTYDREAAMVTVRYLSTGLVDNP
ncbi:MAG TPA: replication initiator protein A [Acidimicrobiia bacterium]